MSITFSTRYAMVEHEAAQHRPIVSLTLSIRAGDDGNPG
jgi:hypothetical protein